jgi:hypothetical protein
MEYTEDQKEQFKQQFAAKRRRQIILMIPFVILAGTMALMGVNGHTHTTPVWGIPSDAIGVVCLIFAVCAVVFSFLNWCCPACGKHLGRGFGPRFCPRCGVELR